jgi:arylsulfate sulfotransferase
MTSRIVRSRCWPILAIAFLHGCDSETYVGESPPPPPPPPPPLAAASDIAAVGSLHGVTPFISFVELRGSALKDLIAVHYTIDGKPGSATKPVAVHYAVSALKQRGYWAGGTGVATLPVFGLYSGYSNHVVVELEFSDASRQTLAIDVVTAPHVHANGVYDSPDILTSRAPGSPLGFDFFAMKSRLGTPIVVDTDGNVRWVGMDPIDSLSSAFYNNGFIVGGQTSPTLSRFELDGSVSETRLIAPDVRNIHHNIEPGKQGLLVEIDVTIDGVFRYESTLTEITGSGTVVRQWDLAALLGAFMLGQGDDPSLFIRPGTDWFHMNGAAYDPSDDSIVVSSRESFVIKLDYATGNIVWIFGDPTKYWYTFPSLRSKAVALVGGGLYPIGQHAPSITLDGLLMVFNNGRASTNQPTGAPTGESRTYSAVSAYRIDAATLTAHEEWSFDYNQTILSDICSSAYETSDKSVLVSYAVADGRTRTRLVGLDRDHRVAFDFEYANPTPDCPLSWNAVPVPFEDLRFD